MAAISPVVQVVTTGTDWPAIVAAITTGVVGLGGIGGTLWQGQRAKEAQTADLKASLEATAENLRLSIRAEDERAHIAERRRIYATCLTAMAVLNLAIFDHRKYREGGGEETGLYRLAQQRDDSISTLSVARLIAPTDVIELLTETVSAYMDYIWRVDDGQSEEVLQDKVDEISTLRKSLNEAMRVDLGEPP